MNTVNELVEYLKKCDEAYYGSGNVLVSNDTYESMVETLKRMDPTNPYLSKVGAEPNGTNKVGRIIPMGTLDKLHEDKEVQDWLAKESGRVLLAPKYDGFGVELTYVDGKLVMASTRGDGTTGEDVTDAIQYVSNVPKIIPEGFSNLTCVRGECIIPREHHDAVKALGYTAMRNAVPGIVRSCRADALEYVHFVAYEFFDGTHDRDFQRTIYDHLFEVETYWVHDVDNFEAILADRNTLGDNKDHFKYEIDGTVLKTISIQEDDLKHPKHQIAWKFKSNRRETILRSVEFAMGVTGRFSVVGIFDEVEFQGAKLTRASLGSVGRFLDLRTKIGAVIEVSRRGDIIPYIEDIIEIPENCTEVDIPKVCPHCGYEFKGYDLRCDNLSCPEKLRLQIMYYVGTIGVKGIGPALVRGLVDSGKIKRLSDVYKIVDDDILSLPRQGQSSVDKWHAFMDKEIQVVKFLSAMPFDDIGPAVWKALLKKWTFEEIMDLTVDKILEANVSGVGDAKARSLVSQIDIYREDMFEMYNKANIK